MKTASWILGTNEHAQTFVFTAEKGLEMSQTVQHFRKEAFTVKTISVFANLVSSPFKRAWERGSVFALMGYENSIKKRLVMKNVSV